MDGGRFDRGGRSAKDSHQEARLIGPPEHGRLVNSGPSERGYTVDLRALAETDRQRLLRELLTDEQCRSLSGLLGRISQLASYDTDSPSYRAWWGQLERLIHQIQSTRAHSLSDSELNALMKEAFVAWEETGIRESIPEGQLRESAERVRKRVGRPTEGERTRAALDNSPRSGPRHVGGQERRV
jgi:hypothetical protein